MKGSLYPLKLFLMTLGLVIGSLFLGGQSQSQVQIADANTELPDFSTYYAGVDAMDAGDFDTAIRLFTESAEDGLEIAQYNLGVLYFSGRGVTQDFAQAFKWTRMAAEQGHTNAQYNLGTLYYNGLGVRSEIFKRWPLSLIYRKSDLQQAASWYQQAAENDHGEAQYNLASMYETGEGVKLDLIKSHVWARLAQDNEVPDATILLNRLQSGLSASQLDRAGREYAQWVLEHRG
ncbi:MAG: hypothetical protein Q7W55_12290 [Pseudohongiella sp.]|nr:hypothetical protein [Pseudohongiella sp.]MDO9518592.1 hypothetical protein [Pseudohongiella sp.]MDP2127208.1 hypothetical protein [Pseudohongiella sp.]